MHERYLRPEQLGLAESERNRRLILALQDRINAYVFNDQGEHEIGPIIEAVRNRIGLPVRIVTLDRGLTSVEEVRIAMGMNFLDDSGPYDYYSYRNEGKYLILLGFDEWVINNRRALRQPFRGMDPAFQLLVLAEQYSPGAMVTFRGGDRKTWDQIKEISQQTYWLAEFLSSFAPLGVIR